MFIRIEIDATRCPEPAACGVCTRVCPVDVFRLEGSRLLTDPENEDECTLCNLCLEQCPQGALRLRKLYEE
ncbi:MAG: 4Fe-4S dicluster domain-containing protein [Chloroflexia bacterium]